MSLYKDISTLQETNTTFSATLETASVAVSTINQFFNLAINLIPRDRINSGSKSIDTDIINNFSLYDSAF